jgi:ribosomal silencing factor RsfS
MAELAVSIASVAAKHIWDALQASIEVNIQNQCSNFELTSPIYFCDNAVCDETPNQRVPSKDSTAAKFRVKFSRFMFQGGILYEVRATSTPSDETDANNPTAETNRNAPAIIRILAAWRVSRYHEPFVFAMLLEHEDTFTWSERRLKEFFDEHSNKFSTTEGRNATTWLMQDGTVLKTVMDVTGRGHYKLEITIAEGTQDQYTTNPLYYEPKK